MCAAPAAVGLNRRRYNLPVSSEVAVIMPDNPEDMQPERDVILYKNDGRLFKISDAHPIYEPTHFVLIFPNGESGFGVKCIEYRSSEGRARRAVRAFYTHSSR